MFATRLKEYIEYQRLSVRAFEQECLISQGTLSRAITKGKTVNSDQLERIAKRWPDLNTDWLLTGDGEMLRTEINTLKIMLAQAEKDAAYWKDLVDTLKLAVKEKFTEKPKK